MNKRGMAGMRTCTRVWLIMMGLTFVTYLIGVSDPGGIEPSLLVLGLALFKGQMLGDYFMGLKGIKGFWRWPVTLWLLIPGGLITTAFLLAS